MQPHNRTPRPTVANVNYYTWIIAGLVGLIILSFIISLFFSFPDSWSSLSPLGTFSIPAVLWIILIIIALAFLVWKFFPKKKSSSGNAATTAATQTSRSLWFYVVAGSRTVLLVILVLIAIPIAIWAYKVYVKPFKFNGEMFTGEKHYAAIQKAASVPSQDFPVITYGQRQLFEKGKTYKFLMLGRDAVGNEHYFTPSDTGTVIFFFKKIGYENAVFWSYQVTRDGHNPVEYRLIQNQNEGTGGWISITANETLYVDVTEHSVVR